MDTVLAVAGLITLAMAIFAIPRLLAGITEWGGDRDDALDVADLFLSEANAFRGGRSSKDVPLDGKNRIAPPTQDGGGG